MSFASEVESLKAARELAKVMPVHDEITTISSVIETSALDPGKGISWC
jgi:hypothetical protein